MELVVVLCACAAAIAIIFIARIVARWGKANPVPELRPLWLGPDLVETTECARTLIDELREKHGLEPLERHPAVDELAQHHAYDMAERGFCGPVDPEGVDLEERLVRLHPTMVGALSEWQRETRELPSNQPAELAQSLLTGSPSEEKALAALVLAEGLNCMGIAVAGSAERATLCIVFAHHWATLVPDRPHLEREGTWPVTVELIEGTTIEQLSAALVADGRTAMAQVRAERFSIDEWEDERACVYLNACDDMEAMRVQWYRLSVGAVPLPLP